MYISDVMKSIRQSNLIVIRQLMGLSKNSLARDCLGDDIAIFTGGLVGLMVGASKVHQLHPYPKQCIGNIDSFQMSNHLIYTVKEMLVI